jgi:hypothetical protein
VHAFVLVGTLLLLHGIQPAWGLPGTTNLARFGTASASNSYFSGPYDATDGNRNGDFWNGGSVWYGDAIPESPLYFEVDLGFDAYIDRVQILRRTDENQSVFGNMRLTIYDDDGEGNPGNVTFTKDYLTGEFGTGGFEFGSWGTTDPGLNNPQGAHGRHVRLERIDNNYWLTFAEFEILGSIFPLEFTESNNIARGKPVTTSSLPGYGSLIGSGNDGNIDGNFGGSGYFPVYHSSTSGVGEYWQVDLGEMTQLDHLQLFSRTDDQTTVEYKVSVLDSSFSEVLSFIVDNPAANVTSPVYDHILNTAGAMGQYLRVETTQANLLAFAELRAFEGPGSPTYTADFNQNGQVDELDLIEWQFDYGVNAGSDADGDGDSDGLDFLIWQRQFGSGVPAVAAFAAIPEPSSATCLLTLTVFLAGGTSRRLKLK